MTCKDCIYHEKCLSHICYGMGTDDLTNEYITDIEKRCTGFKNKVDFAEVKRGEWIEGSNESFCSVCKEPPTTITHIAGKTEVLTRFCPSCGAKMEGLQ